MAIPSQVSPPPATGAPRVERWVKVALLLVAATVLGFIGGLIAANQRSIENTTVCYATGQTDPTTHMPICVYGRPLR